MDIANEILDAIEIIVDKKIRDNTAQIYRGVCKGITTTTCTLTVNGKDNTVKYYGGTPIVGSVYQIFVPSGDMSTAFVIVPGTTGGTGESGVSSVNGKTGNVILNANDVGALPNTTAIPTKTSELDNDSGFIDSSALDGYAKTTDIPTKTSQLTNNSGFITANDVPVKSVDGSIGAVVTNAVKTTSQSLTNEQKAQARTNIGAGTSSFDGDYESLSNKPTIPTQTSQLENNSGFITASDIPVKSVNSKTGNVVLTADDVGALPDTTVIPTVNDATLDVQRNGVSVGTFTANASTDKTINITVPTKASDVGAVSISDVTTTLGTSTTKVPSEKAVSDALSAAGAGDMLKATYDPDGSVASSGGIPAYVEANGGKIDTIKVNGATQPIVNKEVDIAAVTSVNGQTGDVTVTNADTLEGHNAAYFGTAAAVEENSQIIGGISTQVGNVQESVQNLQDQFIQVANNAVYKSGGTMTGALVAKSGGDLTIAQVRNVIISTEKPSAEVGSNGDIWICYTE